MNARLHYPAEGRYALGEHKGLSPLLGSAVKIWLSKPSVFIVAALVVVLPMEILFTGLLGGGFDDPDGIADNLWAAVDAFAVGMLGFALITAAHARAVVALAAGQKVGTLSALRLGGGAFITVLGVAVLYTLAVLAGTIALIIPGIYLSVVLLFSTQVAALTRTGISSSFDSSIKLVRAVGWWRTFGYLLLITVVSFAAVFALAIPFVAVSALAGDSAAGPIAVIFNGVATALIYSFTALVQSLLYFSFRAKVGDAWADESSSGSVDLEAGADWEPAGASGQWAGAAQSGS